MNLPSRASAPRDVVFYFDFVDPLAYLASTRIPRAAREAEAALTLEPVSALSLLEGGARKRRGARAEAQRQLWDGAVQAASRLDVTLTRPSRYPFDSAMLLETCLFVRDRSGQEAMSAVVDSLWSEVWVEGRDPERIETALEAGRGVAMPERVLREALEDPRMPQMLARVTRRAADRGVTGVPALQVGGVLVHGLDDVLDAERLVRGERPRRSGDDGDDGGSADGGSFPDWTFSG